MSKREVRYAKSHEWILAHGESATVGISDHAQKEITDVVFVELPKPGRKVRQGEAVAVVESVKAAFDVYAPASGEVTEANDAVVKDPALVNQSPQDKGWFFKLRLTLPAELESLMTPAQYDEFSKTAAH